MNLDGWEINIDSLPGLARGEAPFFHWHDAIFPSPDARRAVLLYTIVEPKMGWNIGSLAVFESRENPRLILNPKDLWCLHACDQPVTWLTSNFFAVTKYFYDPPTNRVEVPFALIDLDRKVWSFIPIDNSQSYRLSYENHVIELREIRRDRWFTSHDRERHSIEDLKWRSLDQLESFNHFYAESTKSAR